jgi:hypothetical protein
LASPDNVTPKNSRSGYLFISHRLTKILIFRVTQFLCYGNGRASVARTTDLKEVTSQASATREARSDGAYLRR